MREAAELAPGFTLVRERARLQPRQPGWRAHAPNQVAAALLTAAPGQRGDPRPRADSLGEAHELGLSPCPFGKYLQWASLCVSFLSVQLSSKILSSLLLLQTYDA